MKSDNSRSTFDPKKHYSGIIMQQGRVQLDADWNEQQAIHQHRIETGTIDTIGACGVPEFGGGFRINFTPDFSDLTISPGRIYVDGVLCELEKPSLIWAEVLDDKTVHVQTLVVDGRPFQVGQWVELLHPETRQGRLFQIAAIDEKQQTLTLRTDQDRFNLANFQGVKGLELRRITTYTTQPDYPNPAYAYHPQDTHLSLLNLADDHYLLLVYLDVWQRYITSLDDPRLREVALGGPDTTGRLQTIGQIEILPINLADEFREMLEKQKSLSEQHQSLTEATGSGGDPNASKSGRSKAARELQDVTTQMEQNEQEIAKFSSTLTCNTSFPEWEQRIAHSTGTLNARTHPPATPGNPGYQRLENQLYRVEVHQGTPLDTANPQNPPTFKWSRDNGSIVAAITAVNGNRVTIHGVGPDNNLSFTKGQWVEIEDDTRDLDALPGFLTKINDVDPISGELILDGVPAGLDMSRHPKLRRWDGTGNIDVSGTTIPLESGIEVEFSPGTYKTGDYWLIPARTATGEIEWPPYAVPNTNPIPQPPKGIVHHYSRLALVRMYRTNTPIVQDCRRWFPPLASQAMHILGINWSNDGEYTRDKLKEGLRITLDADPDKLSVSSATMIVTVEPTLPGDGESAFIMSGHITVESNIIHWHWGREEEGALPEILGKLDIFFRGHRYRPRVRVTLRGHHIWSRQDDHILYLDGQTFGFPALREDGQTALSAIILPSGIGAKASDFESWFYLTE